MLKLLCAFAALVFASEARARCTTAMYSPHVGSRAYAYLAKEPKVLEPYAYVLERSGIERAPRLCVYTRGVEAIPHVIFIGVEAAEFPTTVLIPQAHVDELTFDELAVILAHEVAHIVRGIEGVKRVHGYTTEEIEVDSLAADWLGSGRVYAGLKAIQGLARRELPKRFRPLHNVALFEADLMRRMFAMERRVQVDACKAEFATQSRMCRGGEGRDDDACFMRIKRQFQACTSRPQHAAAE